MICITSECNSVGLRDDRSPKNQTLSYSKPIKPCSSNWIKLIRVAFESKLNVL